MQAAKAVLCDPLKRKDYCSISLPGDNDNVKKLTVPPF